MNLFSSKTVQLVINLNRIRLSSYIGPPSNHIVLKALTTCFDYSLYDISKLVLFGLVSIKNITQFAFV